MASGPRGDRLARDADPARAADDLGDLVEAAQALERCVRGEGGAEIGCVVGVVDQSCGAAREQALEDGRTEGEQVTLNHDHIGLLDALYGEETTREEEAVKRGLIGRTGFAVFDEALVGRLGDGPNRAWLDAVVSEIGKILQRAVFGAGVGLAVQQEEQRSHLAAASV